MKIAIDLSTTCTGICVLNNENQYMFSANIFFRTFSENNYAHNFKLIREVVEILKPYIINEACEVGIEVSNFVNPQLTNKFNLYAGAFVNEFTKYPQIKRIKLFNSQQWQRLIGCVSSDTREITKEKSRAFAKRTTFCYDENWTEDQCDAYCIGYYLQELLSTEEKKVEVKKRKINDKKKLSEKAKLSQMIATRHKKIATLDKMKNKRQIKTLENEIKELERKKNEL